MDWTIIEDENMYKKVLNRLEKIFDSKRGDPHFKETELLVMLVEKYETENGFAFPN